LGDGKLKYPKAMVFVNKIGAYICGALVAGASILAVMESILRKVFLAPTAWSLNLTMGIFIWGAFLGSSWAFQELGHVSVDMVRNMIDKRSKSPKKMPRRVISIIGYIPPLAVCAAFFYGGVPLFLRAVAEKQTAAYNFKFPIAISYGAIVVGAVMMFFTVLFIILDLFAGGDKYL
jgi:TRAP-type C4-dicarboxylate transport system permease small subunit